MISREKKRKGAWKVLLKSVCLVWLRVTDNDDTSYFFLHDFRRIDFCNTLKNFAHDFIRFFKKKP